MRKTLLSLAASLLILVTLALAGDQLDANSDVNADCCGVGIGEFHPTGNGFFLDFVPGEGIGRPAAFSGSFVGSPGGSGSRYEDGNGAWFEITYESSSQVKGTWTYSDGKGTTDSGSFEHQ